MVLGEVCTSLRIFEPLLKINAPPVGEVQYIDSYYTLHTGINTIILAYHRFFGKLNFRREHYSTSIKLNPPRKILDFVSRIQTALFRKKNGLKTGVQWRVEEHTTIKYFRPFTIIPILHYFVKAYCEIYNYGERLSFKTQLNEISLPYTGCTKMLVLIPDIALYTCMLLTSGDYVQKSGLKNLQKH
jgi:hypothetical protein